MGFTTGLLGGATLTYSILYLSLYLHRANRSVQHTLLSQQSTLLNSVVDPLPPPLEAPAYTVRSDSLTETMKDRWNAEIETLVRRAQHTDWDAVRERWERRAGNVWTRLRGSDIGQELEDRFKSNVLGTEEGAKKGVADLKDAAKSEMTGRRLLEEK